MTLASANLLWAQDGAQWEAPFLDTLARFYDADVRRADFADAAAARDAINGRVAGTVEMGQGSAPVDGPVELTVDRPFVFVLHDVETATPLFVGRVTDPLA